MNDNFNMGELIEVDLDSIKPHPNNPHKIRDNDVAMVQNSIKDFGYIQPIAIWTDNVIRIGHTRYQALKNLGVKKVKVVLLSRLTREEADALLAIDNQTHSGFTWDFENLAELVQKNDSVEWGKYFSADSLSTLFGDEEENTDEPESAAVDLPIEYKIIVTLDNEREQTTLFDELTRKGYDCFIPGGNE